MSAPPNIIIDFGPVAAWSAWRWFHVAFAIFAGWMSAAALVDGGRWIVGELVLWLRCNARADRIAMTPTGRRDIRRQLIRNAHRTEASRG